ncbi:uncharacterized protein LOC107874485 [Capsicum annuum]|uniref:uncharacterized protein LOC107874485 n=1 Tax=Capsicum annuum TaxID=4072 RepID=UPI0007BEEBF3|nr:uncharacterized protein LOC107874485 [Capsicum annuum]
METNCLCSVQKYHQCLIHGDFIHVPPIELNVMSSPWLFVAWGIDIIDPIKLAVSNRHRFGVLESFIIDNVANFTSGLMREIDENFKITHHNSTPFHPLINGEFEASNKNIKWILRNMIDNYKHWHENLPFSLLGYPATIRTSTGTTPYLLVYGTEVVYL